MLLDPTTLIAITGAAAGLSAGAVQVFKARQERRQAAAGTEQTVVSTAVDMAERLTATASSLLGPLQQQLQQAQAEVMVLRERLARLEGQFETATHEYQEAKRREEVALERAEHLQRELEHLAHYLRSSSLDEGAADALLARFRRVTSTEAAPTRNRVWTEAERAEHRRRLIAG